MSNFIAIQALKALSMAIEALKVESVNLEELSQALTDEVIAAHEQIGYDQGRRDGYAEALEAKPYQEFCEWVAEEIFGDEGDYWENVKDAFPELACRRLHKLGIVHKEGDKWVWVDRKELEDG